MALQLDQLRILVLDLMSQPKYNPLRKRALAKKLQIEMDDYGDFRSLIDALLHKGDIAELKRGKYGLPKPEVRSNRAALSAMISTKSGEEEVSLKGLPSDAIVGRIDVKRGGFGFLISDSSAQDLYIAEEDLGGALSGDIVAVSAKRRPKPHQGGRRQGDRRQGGMNSKARVIRILKRAHATVVGTYYDLNSEKKSSFGAKRIDRGGYIVPDTRGLAGELAVLPEDRGEARAGDKVAAELIEPDTRNRSGHKPTVRIVHVFGKAGEAEAEFEAIVQNFNLQPEFPPGVLQEIEGLSTEIPQAEFDQRIDYTTPMTFTIDPVDAKDHDDAVAMRVLDSGHTEILVHIADVSHYVRPGTRVDDEARERGTSVYLPGRVMPMLPEKLCNRLCSLKEGELRLTQTARLVFNRGFEMEAVHIERSYIRSAAFLNYDQVYDALEKNRPDLLPSQEIFDVLQAMKAFAAKLRDKRLASGALELDLPEIKVKLDEHFRVLGTEKRESHWAHQLIEDMMLAANRAVAGYLVDHEIPGLFRVHEDPEDSNLERFAEFAKELGISVKKPYNRHALQSVLDRVKGKDFQHAVHLAMLTSLKQARYAAECQPHYALNWNQYLHFTSPIRRYPDLIVHRMLKERFEPGQTSLPVKGKRRKGGEHTAEFLTVQDALRGLAQHCSYRERNADAAEKEVKKYFLIQHLQQNQRTRHPGIITGVRDFGLFVELQDCYVEGMIRIQDLGDDYYDYYPDKHLLQGRRSRRSFQLGDKVDVKVVHIDAGQKKVSLMLA